MGMLGKLMLEESRKRLKKANRELFIACLKFTRLTLKLIVGIWLGIEWYLSGDLTTVQNLVIVYIMFGDN